MCTQEGFLNDIFGILGIPSMTQSEGVQSMLVHSHYLPKVAV